MAESPDTPFLLDRTENPHPQMLTGAHAARAAVKASHGQDGWAVAYWRGYLAAMADATGCPPVELEEWMDRNPVPGSEHWGTRVAVSSDRQRAEGA